MIDNTNMVKYMIINIIFDPFGRNYILVGENIYNLWRTNKVFGRSSRILIYTTMQSIR